MGTIDIYVWTSPADRRGVWPFHRCLQARNDIQRPSLSAVAGG
jgi:hypothetical protein